MTQPKIKKDIKARTSILSILVLILLLTGFFFAIRIYLNIGNDNYTNSAQVETFINPINARISAYIKEIKFVEYQKVNKGDTLVVLDNREVLTQIGQAQAAYENALATKQATQNSIRTASNNVKTSESNAQSTEAKLWNAQQNFNRYKQLLKEESVTQQQFDQMKTEYDATKAQFEAAKNTKESALLSVQEVKAKLAINDAEILRTENALKMAELNLSYCYIIAPNDGIIGHRTINVGQLLTMPGQQVATIVDSQNKWVVANFREKQMPKVVVGEKVSISVDALNGAEYEGKITEIAGATGAKVSAIPIDNSTGNFVKVQQRIPVRIDFTAGNTPEALSQLRGGMNVEVSIKE